MKAVQVFEVVFNVLPLNLNKRLTAGREREDLITGPNAERLAVGTIGKTMDQIGRRFIVIGTPFGNVVLHDFDANKKPGVIVSLAPKEFDALDLYGLSSEPSVVQDNQICDIVGYDKTGKNVGHRVKELLTA